jgi:XRE family aerobic/anaerobic benzoate catabolism transcriptional regulator
MDDRGGSRRKQGREPVASKGDRRHPFLIALGERVRSLRSRRGMTRKEVSLASNVSERHLANLEHGTGNASVLILFQVAKALQCSVSELIGDVTTSSPEWLLIRELLENRGEAELHKVRVALGDMLDTRADRSKVHRKTCIALIGLRGAGKSTLGHMLAEDLGYPFVELSAEIEKFAGFSISEIQALYGQNAYRRYERRALEETVQLYPEAVIAIPGGLVSEPATFNLLLQHCMTIWLQADPEDHMKRVLAQGDTRPMASSREAMEDLKSILAGRAAFYAKADHRLDTSAAPLAATFGALRELVRGALGLPA